MAKRAKRSALRTLGAKDESIEGKLQTYPALSSIHVQIGCAGEWVTAKLSPADALKVGADLINFACHSSVLK